MNEKEQFKLARELFEKEINPYVQLKLREQAKAIFDEIDKMQIIKEGKKYECWVTSHLVSFPDIMRMKKKYIK